MEKTNAEKEKIIVDFLHEHGERYFTCALATCTDNEPRNTPVDARNDGLTMYFVSDRGGKLANIRKNPRVCLAVFMPVGKGYMKNARGLQMWGTAHILTLRDNPAEFRHGYEIIRVDEISIAGTDMPLPEQVKETLHIIKVVPHRISYFDATGGKPDILVWEAATQSD